MWRALRTPGSTSSMSLACRIGRFRTARCEAIAIPVAITTVSATRAGDPNRGAPPTHRRLLAARRTGAPRPRAARRRRTPCRSSGRSDQRPRVIGRAPPAARSAPVLRRPRGPHARLRPGVGARDHHPQAVRWDRGREVGRVRRAGRAPASAPRARHAASRRRQQRRLGGPVVAGAGDERRAAARSADHQQRDAAVEAPGLRVRPRVQRPDDLAPAVGVGARVP